MTALRKGALEIQSEDQLKSALLDLILGSGEWKNVKQSDREFYCARMTDWARILGWRPHTQPQK